MSLTAIHAIENEEQFQQKLDILEGGK